MLVEFASRAKDDQDRSWWDGMGQRRKNDFLRSKWSRENN